MDARLQRRVQRYGWDLAVDAYARQWRAPLAGVQAELLARAAPAAGEHVLDVACGPGDGALAAARRVGPGGSVLGVDLSAAMVAAARARARRDRLPQARFARMPAESLALREPRFDLALCSLGLMYATDVDGALRELRRVLRPGGRVGLAVWGERERCGWSPLFGIVDDEVRSEVCPLFFALGQRGVLTATCERAGLRVTGEYRRSDALRHADDDAVCEAAFAGGPVALAWSRFAEPVRRRVRERYLASVARWRDADGYRIPAEFVLVTAMRPT